MRGSSLKIGQILINMNAITPEMLQKALARQKETDKHLGEILLEEKLITEQTLCQALAKQFSMQYIDLGAVEIDPKISEIVPETSRYPTTSFLSGWTIRC